MRQMVRENGNKPKEKQPRRRKDQKRKRKRDRKKERRTAVCGQEGAYAASTW